MKRLLYGIVALVVLGAAPATADDIVFKPIDTSKLVVQPSNATGTLVGRTISAIGKTAAGAIENNGYVKTINNVFSKKIVVPHTQLGPSALPAPTRFASTYYKSYNQPVRPVMQRR